MSVRTYLWTVAAIFGVMALLHLARVLRGWPAVIGGWDVPHWVSWVALVIAGYLCYEGARLGRKR